MCEPYQSIKKKPFIFFLNIILYGFAIHNLFLSLYESFQNVAIWAAKCKSQVSHVEFLNLSYSSLALFLTSR